MDVHHDDPAGPLLAQRAREAHVHRAQRGRTANVPGKTYRPPISFDPLVPIATGGKRSTVPPGLRATMPRATSLASLELRNPSVNAGR